MILKQAHSPVFANANRTAINIMVEFEGIDFAIPFTATADDVTAHGADIFNRAMTLEFGEIAAFTPAIQPPKQFTSLEFLDMFTQSEQLAVVSAAMASAQVKLWYDRMLAAMYVSLADPRTGDGLQALVSAGLLTQARRDAIVAAMA